MKKIHEMQSTEEFNDVEKEKIYTPIEDLQRITAGGVFKRNHLFGSVQWEFTMKSQGRGIAAYYPYRN